MTMAYEKAREALARGESVRLQRWRKLGFDQHGRPVEVVEILAIFEARLSTHYSSDIPMIARELWDGEADLLEVLPNVIDERSEITDGAEAGACRHACDCALYQRGTPESICATCGHRWVAHFDRHL